MSVSKWLLVFAAFMSGSVVATAGSGTGPGNNPSGGHGDVRKP
jgi:hypothetical protein